MNVGLKKGFRTNRHEGFHPLKNYRVVRKFLAKQQGLTEFELECLITLDDEYFNRKRFKEITLTGAWDKKRFKKLKENGWVETWRKRNNYHAELFKPTGKSHRLVRRIYKILAGEEDLPMSGRRNILERKLTENLSYSEKLLRNAVRVLNERANNNKFE